MLTAIVATLTVVVAVLTVLVVGLLRSHAEILRRLHDLGADAYDDGPGHTAGRAQPSLVPADDAGLVGHRAPDAIAGSSPTGGALSVALAGRDEATLVAFLSSGCVTCATFWDELANPRQASLGPGIRVVIVTKDPDREAPGEIARLAPPGLTTVMSSAAWTAFSVTASPYFTLVEAGGAIVGEGTAQTWSQVSGLLDRAAAEGLLGVDRGAHRGRRAGQQ